jgi:hypothetical protein
MVCSLSIHASLKVLLQAKGSTMAMMVGGGSEVEAVG